MKTWDYLIVVIGLIIEVILFFSQMAYLTGGILVMYVIVNILLGMLLRKKTVELWKIREQTLIKPNNEQ